MALWQRWHTYQKQHTKGSKPHKCVQRCAREDLNNHRQIRIFCVVKNSGRQVGPSRCHGNHPLWGCKSVFLNCVPKSPAGVTLKICSFYHFAGSALWFLDLCWWPWTWSCAAKWKSSSHSPSGPGDPRQRYWCGSDLCLWSSGALPPHCGSPPDALPPVGPPRTTGIRSRSVGWWVFICVFVSQCAVSGRVSSRGVPLFSWDFDGGEDKLSFGEVRLAED